MVVRQWWRVIVLFPFVKRRRKKNGFISWRFFSRWWRIVVGAERKTKESTTQHNPIQHNPIQHNRHSSISTIVLPILIRRRPFALYPFFSCSVKNQKKNERRTSDDLISFFSWGQIRFQWSIESKSMSFDSIYMARFEYIPVDSFFFLHFFLLETFSLLLCSTSFIWPCCHNNSSEKEKKSSRAQHVDNRGQERERMTVRKEAWSILFVSVLFQFSFLLFLFFPSRNCDHLKF